MNVTVVQLKIKKDFIAAFEAEMKRLVRKECCTDDAPARLRDWVRQLATEKPKPAE